MHAFIIINSSFYFSQFYVVIFAWLLELNTKFIYFYYLFYNKNIKNTIFFKVQNIVCSILIIFYV